MCITRVTTSYMYNISKSPGHVEMIPKRTPENMRFQEKQVIQQTAMKMLQLNNLHCNKRSTILDISAFAYPFLAHSNCMFCSTRYRDNMNTGSERSKHTLSALSVLSGILAANDTTHLNILMVSTRRGMALPSSSISPWPSLSII